VGDVVEMVEVDGELRVQPVEVTRKQLQAELDEIFGRGSNRGNT